MQYRECPGGRCRVDRRTNSLGASEQTLVRRRVVDPHQPEIIVSVILTFVYTS